MSNLNQLKHECAVYKAEWEAALAQYKENQEGRALVEHAIYNDAAPIGFYEDWMREIVCLSMNCTTAGDKYEAALTLYNIELEKQLAYYRSQLLINKK
jgi:hypothetical protein